MFELQQVLIDVVGCQGEGLVFGEFVQFGFEVVDFYYDDVGGGGFEVQYLEV